MLLPNYKRALIAREKIVDYALNSDHPVEKHKARLFRSALDVGPEDCDVLVEAIAEALGCFQCAEGEEDSFGQRYTVDFDMTVGVSKAPIRSAWIVKAGEDFPRLTSVYIRTKLLPRSEN